MPIAFIEFTAVNPGIDGSRINVNLVPVADGSTVVVSVIETNFKQYSITVTVGVNGGTGAINVGTWADVAALVNISAAGSVISAVGSAGTIFVSGTSVGQLENGWEGNGTVLP